MHKIPLIARVVSLYILVAISIVFAVQVPQATASTDNNKFISQITAVEPTNTKPVTGTPVRLQIPSLNIDLPIELGKYDSVTDTWTLSNTAVHFADSTSPVNDKSGNTLIYGHARQDLLGPTVDLAPQAVLIITTDNGHVFTYTYSGNEVVNPQDTSVLQKTSDKPLLTLLTCDGLFYEKRRLMTFEFRGVN